MAGAVDRLQIAIERGGVGVARLRATGTSAGRMRSGDCLGYVVDDEVILIPVAGDGVALSGLAPGEATTLRESGVGPLAVAMQNLAWSLQRALDDPAATT